MKFIIPTCAVFVIVFLNIMQVEGAANISPLKYKNEYGEKVGYCKHSKKLWLLPGSTIRDYKKCQECECTDAGYACHDLTMNYTYNKATSKCKMVEAGCVNKWVLKNDDDQTCPEEDIPSYTAIGK